MKIPFLTLSYQHKQIKEEIFQKWNELYERTEFVYHQTGKEFEKNFSAYNNSKFACALDTGTSAVELALRAAGIGSGDEVITVANTFIATVAAIHFAGAKPVFVEVNPDTWNIDSSKIEEKITDRTKAVLAVNLYGQPADMLEIRNITKKLKLLFISDAAQSIGSKIKENGIWKNPSEFTDISAFSFYPGKNLGACGEAGAVVTDNEKYAEYIAMFRDHGSKIKYIHDFVGKNNRIDAFQAAALNIKLQYITEWNEKRRHVAEWYYEELKSIDEIQLPYCPSTMLPVYHLFVILVTDREDFQNYLALKGVGTALHYKIPVHLQKAFSYLNLREGTLPITESIVRKNVSLPMYPELTHKEIKYISTKVKEYFVQKK